MKTTFQKIKDHHFCKDGWEKLIKHFNPTSLDEEILISNIIESNGIRDAIWALRAVEDRNRVMLFCADVAESVLHIYEAKHPENKAPREVIEAIRLFVNGRISKEDLKIKKKAADAAAYAATAHAAAYAAHAAAYAAYAADAATDAAAYAATADATAYAVHTAAAYAAAAYTVDATAYAYADAYAAALDKKWQEIETILRKYLIN